MSQTPIIEVANQLRVERDIAIDQRDRARAENRELRDEVQRLKAKVNRMVRSAAIVDIHGGQA